MPASDAGRDDAREAMDVSADAVDVMDAESCMPSPPYAGRVGTSFPPFELFDCAGSRWAFYEGESCGSPTLVAIVAGWYYPSIRESMELTERYVRAFPSLRVVVVIVQTEDYLAPDAAYCVSWQERYGLTDAEVVTDPEQAVSVLTLGGDEAIGTSFLVDRRGTIRYRYNGWDELTAAALDEGVIELLSEE